ncbi:MAG: hypothetical protein ACXW0J_04915, partial [Nitrososphaeraceae archaeon]
MFIDQQAFAKVEDDKDSKNNDDEDDKEDAIDTDKNISITSSYSKYDKFGIEKIYPTKTGGEEWFMNMNNIYDDKQFFPFGESDSKYSNSNMKISKNEDLSWKI